MAGFSLFSNDPGAAERMTDTRFRSALAGMPETVTAVWMESDWVLAQTAKGSTHEDWDTMAAMLAVCAAVARVLPPRMGATQAVDFHDCDPSRPLPVPPSYFEDEPEEDLPEMPQITRHAPELGQDNEAVYGELLGLDAAALNEYREKHVI